MRRTVAVSAAAALLTLAGCTGQDEETATPPPSTTQEATQASESQASSPTTQDTLAADQALVRTLYYDNSLASSQGVEALAAFMASRNHPDFAFSEEQCAAFLAQQGLTDSYSSSTVPDVAAMAVDDTWTVPTGTYTGLKPSGRVYIVPVEFSETDPQTGLDDSRSSQVHVSIVDDTAYFFQPCE